MNQLGTMPTTIESLQEELALTRAELNKSNLLFQNIIEANLAGYWLWNLKENDLYLSPTLKAMFGYEDHELKNSKDTIDELMFDEDIPHADALMELHIKSNGAIPYKREVRYIHKNGSTIWVICTGKIVEHDLFGEPSLIAGCHMNVTDLKKSIDLEKYAEELEIKNQEMEQFAYVASHDLQEPLNTIKGLVNLLDGKLENHPDEEIKEYLSYLNLGTTRMSDLIKGLLEYSKIGKASEISRVDCQELVEGIIKDYNSLITETEATIKVDKLPKIMGYKTELRIVFQNLIGNALKYRRDKKPMIHLKNPNSKNEWKFIISDNGIGISPENHNKIFKLYQRLHSKREYEGNGLGLAHCQKIIEELHQGKIWVESNASQGSEFHFTIPK